MNYLNLQTELRGRLATFSAKTAASCAQGMTDLPKQAEDLVAGLLRELLGYRNIRNLNTGAGFFPGLDLADDERRTAFQVTATTSLDKIKQTLSTVIEHGLHEKYPDLRFFILTARQDTYSQSAIDKIIGGRFRFSVNEATWDYRDLLRMSTHASPVALRRAIDVFDAYDSGALESFAAADFDPPHVMEMVEANLVELYFPKTLYMADLLDRPGPRTNGRKHARKSAQTLKLKLPSDFEVFEGKVLTFHDLEISQNPFHSLCDRGTATAILSREFWEIDGDHENIFKSLLRFSLQQQLFRKRIEWRHMEGLFVFLPLTDGKLERVETWTDKKTNTRTVVIYKASKRDPSKGGFRHLAFQADFLRADDEWFIAVRPDWYFSTNPDFRPSPIGSKLMKGLKRLENNKSVEQHFRFLWRWLQSESEGDLLTAKAGHLSFGEMRTFDTHPALDDDRWLPFKGEPIEVEPPSELAELMLE
ncbi:MAG TPA: SMEK domain-containing protein [Candidatus Binatia bacterium]|nr:SMEK domain-containing protein [Candidatus Binatia bacterium]